MCIILCVRELWRQEATIDQSLQSTRDELTRLERNLRATVSKSTNRGLDAVKKIAEERQLSGVYGPLIDNFVLKKEEAAVAVDVTAGNRFVIAVCSSLSAFWIVETPKWLTVIISVWAVRSTQTGVWCVCNHLLALSIHWLHVWFFFPAPYVQVVSYYCGYG